MKYKSRYPLLLLILLLPFAGKTQGFEKQKNITKLFAVNKDCCIQINNKYGDIHIVPWDKDSACFSIDIKVTDKKESEAEKALAGIDVEFTNTPYYLVSKTIFRDSKSQIMTDFSDMANSLFNPVKKVEIRYIVNLPQEATIKVENKFGNIYTTNHSGSVQIILSNGDLKANNLTGDTKINLSFGNGVVNTIKNGKLTVGYSELEIRNTVRLAIESKSAKISIAKAGNLDINSKRDKYYIDTVNTLSGQTDFSYINIYYLTESFFVKSVYGEINFAEIVSGFKFVNLSAEYTDIKLCFQKTSSVNVEMLCKKTELNYPPAVIGIQKQVLNEKTSEYKASGIIGTETQPGSSVQINAVSGSIVINSK